MADANGFLRYVKAVQAGPDNPDLSGFSAADVEIYKKEYSQGVRTAAAFNIWKKSEDGLNEARKSGVSLSMTATSDELLARAIGDMGSGLKDALAASPEP